jgi:hypothetical protein
MKREYYSYKEHEYYIQEKVQMKNPITREWEDALIYIQIGSNKKFCREREEFYKLFKFEGYLKVDN